MRKQGMTRSLEVTLTKKFMVDLGDDTIDGGAGNDVIFDPSGTNRY